MFLWAGVDGVDVDRGAAPGGDRPRRRLRARRRLLGDGNRPHPPVVLRAAPRRAGRGCSTARRDARLGRRAIIDRVTLRLPSGVGVLPSQLLREAIDAGWIGGDGVVAEAIQPASLDLRLGDRFYPLRCSFLPGEHTVEQRMEPLIFDELKLDESGAVLERGRPYLIPLAETLDLPPEVKGKANPKSSTGRVDVFTRVITDYSDRFDEIQPGYRGQLYLEVVPLSFAVRVRKGLTLNQLRLSVGDCAVTGAELRDIQRSDPLLFRGSTAVAVRRLAAERRRGLPVARPEGRQAPRRRVPRQADRAAPRHGRRRSPPRRRLLGARSQRARPRRRSSPSASTCSSPRRACGCRPTSPRR